MTKTNQNLIKEFSKHNSKAQKTWCVNKVSSNQFKKVRKFEIKNYDFENNLPLSRIHKVLIFLHHTASSHTLMYQKMLRKSSNMWVKSPLFNNQQTWMDKGNGFFNVTMSEMSGVEVCELVGSFLLFPYHGSIAKETLDFKGLTIWQFLKASVVSNLRKLKKIFKNIFNRQT